MILAIYFIRNIAKHGYCSLHRLLQRAVMRGDPLLDFSLSVLYSYTNIYCVTMHYKNDNYKN